jgi:class 3 adenylate cyclase
MSLIEDLKNKIRAFAKEPYTVDETTIVPDTDYSKLTFGNKGVTCDFAFLYIDIRNSSKLHEKYGFIKAAKIYQSFHEINVSIINNNSGSVRAFDGDRVLGVFAGSTKNGNAVLAAMKIQWAIRNLLNPTLETQITCGAGIDYGKTLVTKIGKGRDNNNNDLIWLGKASNHASHLANEANNSIIISTETHGVLPIDRKISSDKREFWTPKIITLKNGSKVNCFESEWGYLIN